MGSKQVLAVLAVLAGCGASAPSSLDTDSFSQDVAAATQALGVYQSATQSMNTAADCSSAVNGYGTPMQGDLDHMMSVSGSMDDQIRSMGQPSRSDVGCGVQGMDDELGHHLQVACHDADMDHDRQEAARHVAAMGNALRHMQMRVAEVSAQTMVPGMMDGGWRMWDGGTMDPDDHPMGCPGGPRMDGGMMPGGGPGPIMDGGTWDAGPMPMMDGGMGHMP
jgi:hypothetical protein